MAFVNKARDHINHLGDVICRAWHMVWIKIAQGRHVIQIPLCGLGCNVADAAPAFGSAGVNLVVYIGEIAHVGDVIGTIHMA